MMLNQNLLQPFFVVLSLFVLVACPQGGGSDGTIVEDGGEAVIDDSADLPGVDEVRFFSRVRVDSFGVDVDCTPLDGTDGECEEMFTICPNGRFQLLLEDLNKGQCIYQPSDGESITCIVEEAGDLPSGRTLSIYLSQVPMEMGGLAGGAWTERMLSGEMLAEKQALCDAL